MRLISLIVEWENSCKAFTKAKAVVEKEGVPGFFIKYLAELEDFVQNVSNFLVVYINFSLVSFQGGK